MHDSAGTRWGRQAVMCELHLGGSEVNWACASAHLGPNPGRFDQELRKTQYECEKGGSGHRKMKLLRDAQGPD